jgi:nucleotide-binding universal stress UspA family protein
MKKGMKILIAYDGSEPSKHALNQGASLAQLTESEITILSVVPRIIIPFLPDEEHGAYPELTAQDIMEHQAQIKELHTSSLKEAEDHITEKYPDLKVEIRLLEGRPSSTIVEQAENDGVDLIVIGSRGIGGITGWILGSTSHKVVESCTVPVLVVK